MKKHLNSIRLKIILILCIFILPINILLLIMTQRISSNISRQLLDTYANEIALYMKQVDAALGEMDSFLSELMFEDWEALRDASDPSKASVRKYVFWKALSDKRSRLPLADCAYLHIGWNKETVLTKNNSVVNFEAGNHIKSFIQTIDTNIHGAWQPVNIDDRTYIIDDHRLYDNHFGILILAETLLKGIGLKTGYRGERLVLADASGVIMGAKFEISVGDAAVQNLDFGGGPERFHVMRVASAHGGFSLVRLIPENELIQGLPLFERIVGVIGILSFLMIPIVLLCYRKIIIVPLNQLDTAMGELERGNLDYRLSVTGSSSEFEHMDGVFNHMAAEISDLKIQAYERALENARIEASNLRLQINPHLLLNSLNMIYSLAQSREFHYIQDYTLNLVDYFRYSLQRTDHLVSLKEELAFVQSYVKVQKIRFPKRFEIIYDVDDGLGDIPIPPLLVQNFVENSIKYGMCPDRIIEILIIGVLQNDALVLSICDTGSGMDEKQLEAIRKNEIFEDGRGTHIGIHNCRRRLDVFYQGMAVFSITSRSGEGTQIWMSIPVNKANGGKDDDVAHS